MRRLQNLLTVALVGALGALALGCAEEAPPFPEGQGQTPNPSAVYPAGPYGVEKGAIIANYKFVGFPTPLLDKAALREIQLADFYNPTGSESFPAGSIYGERPKPKALMLGVSAVWCAPCQYENEVILPVEYEKYAPLGVEFFLQLADGPSVGKPAETKHLVSWVTKYDTAWPAVIDPSYKLSSLFEADAFPANMIIDTKTMKLVEIIAGVPEQGGPFFDALDDLLAQ